MNILLTKIYPPIDALDSSNLLDYVFSWALTTCVIIAINYSFPKIGYKLIYVDCRIIKTGMVDGSVDIHE